MTNAERQKSYRERQKALRKGDFAGNNVTALVMGVTDTDTLFEQDRPGYYIFGDVEPWERKCWKCGEKYQTRLELNKFCSPKCKNEYLAEAVNEGALWRARE